MDSVTGTHCSACVWHVEGEEELFIGLTGIEISECEYEFDAVVDEDGSGHLSNIALTPDPACLSEPCLPPREEGTWPLSPMQETGPYEVATQLRFCLLNASDEEFHCDLPLHVSEDPSQSHRYIWTAASSYGGSGNGTFVCPTMGVGVRVTWVTELAEGESQIEIEHS